MSDAAKHAARRAASPRAASVWAGVDVGGLRKGFHAAVVDEVRVLDLVRGPIGLPTPDAVVTWLRRWPVRLVAVDSPRALAPDGGRRHGERRVVREVCGLRYTPSRLELDRQKQGRAPRFYEWIECGLALYDALAAAGLASVECFPTAAWTRWYRPRGSEPRATWSRRALAGLRLRGVPSGLGQDGRDALGAAVTARDHERGWTESFGDITVPRPPGGRASR
jgi:hypothetical protein